DGPQQRGVGAQGNVGCLANPKKVDRLLITCPGVYENYLVDSNWQGGNRVKITAGNVTLRHCELRNATGNGVGVFAGDVVIESCKKVQFDPDRKSPGKVVIEDCTFWTGPLPQDAAGFKKGERPGENAVDTKTPPKGERCRLVVRNCYLHGWKQPG